MCSNSTTLSGMFATSLTPQDFDIGFVDFLNGSGPSDWFWVALLHHAIPVTALLLLICLSLNFTKSTNVLERNNITLLLLFGSVIGGTILASTALWHTFELLQIAICEDPNLNSVMIAFYNARWFIVIGVTTVSLLSLLNLCIRGRLTVLFPTIIWILSISVTALDFYIMDFTADAFRKKPNMSFMYLNAMPLKTCGAGLAIVCISSTLLIRKRDSYLPIRLSRNDNFMRNAFVTKKGSFEMEDLQVFDENYKKTNVDPTFTPLENSRHSTQNGLFSQVSW